MIDVHIFYGELDPPQPCYLKDCGQPADTRIAATHNGEEIGPFFTCIDHAGEVLHNVGIIGWLTFDEEAADAEEEP